MLVGIGQAYNSNDIPDTDETHFTTVDFDGFM
jgi:hypothetical protein